MADVAASSAPRDLRARALRVFGLVIPDIRNAVYTSLQRGVEDVARASEFFVLLANTDEQPDRQTEYLRMLLAERVAGALSQHPAAHGFLLRRHGLYTWGKDLAQAKRHVEILEFLLETVGRSRSIAGTV